MGSVRVPYTPSSAGTARHQLVGALRSYGMPRDVVDDACLVISELVGNAIRHAAPLEGGSLRVNWTVADDAVRISVTDGGEGGDLRARATSLDAIDGRGLAIIQQLSTDWGVDRRRGRTTVWARLRRRDPSHAVG